MLKPKSKIKFLVCFGTRPEFIKLLQLIRLLKSDSRFELSLACSSQQKEWLEELYKLYAIKPEYQSEFIEQNKQNLEDIPNYEFATEQYNTVSLTSRQGIFLSFFTDVINSFQPDFVIVQGDTLSTYCAALACFYARNPKLVHIEAGLRTYNIDAPFPEEFYRRSIALIADVHFAVDASSYEGLKQELARTLEPTNNHSKEPIIYQVGNTVQDALMIALTDLKKKYFDTLQIKKAYPRLKAKLMQLNYNLDKQNLKPKILLTSHRKENLNEDFIANLTILIKYFTDYNFYFLEHKNPLVMSLYQSVFALDNVQVIPSLPYTESILRLFTFDAVMTDSGGLTEELSYLNIRTLVLRTSNDRAYLKLHTDNLEDLSTCLDMSSVRQKIQGFLTKLEIQLGSNLASQQTVWLAKLEERLNNAIELLSLSVSPSQSIIEVLSDRELF